MVYFDTAAVKWKYITEVWFNTYKEKYPMVCTLLKSLFPIYIPKLITFVTFDAKQAIPIHPLILIKNMLKVIGSFFGILRTSVLKQIIETDEVKKIDPLDHSLFYSKYNKNASTNFERIFIFACFWSFEASLSEDSRSTFDHFIKDTMRINGCNYPFPQKFTCYDYYIDTGRFSLMV